MNILVEGRERFRVVELTEGRSFHTADTAPVDDEDDPAPEAVVERARSLFGNLRELTGSSVEVPAAELPQLSYALASRVELASEVKLGLLAEVSERLRLEQVCEILEEAAVAVERQRRAAERAATNGKVDLG
jgi:hypothetical protein